MGGALIEATAIKDIYVDDIGAVEVLGGTNVRLVYYSWRGVGELREKIIVARLVIPASALGRGKISRLLTEQRRGDAGELVLHH